MNQRVKKKKTQKGKLRKEIQSKQGRNDNVTIGNGFDMKAFTEKISLEFC